MAVDHSKEMLRSFAFSIVSPALSKTGGDSVNIQERTMASKSDAKVVHVETEKFDGWASTVKATVTLDDGRSGTGKGYSKEEAIENAAEKAKRE
jgi:hypothetical protein